MKLSTLERKKYRVRNKLKKVSNVNRYRLSVSRSSKNIFAQYKYAYERKDNKSTLFIEYGDFYATK